MKWELCITMIILMCLALVACGGCEEAQQQTNIWGEGELPPHWRGFFGDGNLARLNFVQSQALDQHQAIIYGFEDRDPDGQVIRKRGLIERITALEGQIEKLKVVDPNE